MDSYRNSFDSLSDLSHMFASPDHHHDDAPPTISYLFDHQGVVTTNKERERERGGKMANMYSILHALLPNIISNKQVSREKIVTEAIELIKGLEADKVRLEKQLMIRKNAVVDVAKVASSSSSSTFVDVSVAMSSRAVVAFEIKLRSRMKTTTKIMMSLTEIFGKYGAELLTASVVVADDDERSTATATTKVAVTAGIVDGERNGAVVEGIKRELLLLVSQATPADHLTSYSYSCGRVTDLEVLDSGVRMILVI